MIINTMKNTFLRIFHLFDYQAVTSTIKYERGNQHKTLILCALQVLAKIMDTHIGNISLLVKIPTYILGYTRNTHMVTHDVILSAAKDLLAGNTKPTPQLQSLRRCLYPTWQSTVYNVILSVAKDLLAVYIYSI